MLVLLHEQSHCLQSICAFYIYFIKIYIHLLVFFDFVFRTPSQITGRLIAITWNDFSKVFSKSLGGDLVISDMGCFCPNPFSRLAVGHLGQHGCKGHLSEWRQASPAKGWLSARAHAMRDHIHKALLFIFTPGLAVGHFRQLRCKRQLSELRRASQEGIQVKRAYISI